MNIAGEMKNFLVKLVIILDSVETKTSMLCIII